MKADLYLRNALVVTEHNKFQGGVVVRNGRIEKLIEGDTSVQAEEVVDLEGNLLLPGIVDSHTHFNEPGRIEWEGYTPGSFAAAASGITTIFEMPFNSLPTTSNEKFLEEKRQAVQDKSIVDYGHWGLVENGNLSELPGMYRAGVIGFKGFMCNPGEFNLINDFELYEAMEQVARLGSIIGLHAESEPLAQGFTAREKQAGCRDPRAWADSRPPIVELEALQKAVLFALETGCRVHIAHVTVPEGFDIILSAKAKGAKVTGETCPHYLTLDEDDFVRIGPAAKCSPPIRKRNFVEGLWKRVLAGDVDVLCSDHSPTTIENKHLEEGDIWKVWGGISGIQMMLPLLFTEGIHKRGLRLEDLVRMTSYNPARLYGIYPEKGHLSPGADADFMVVDPNREWTLTADMLLSRHKISPFVGKKFKGQVKQTILRGKTIFLNGEIVTKPGYGQLVKPSMPIDS